MEDNILPDPIILKGQRILLEDLALSCHIGLSDEERAVAQTLLVSMVLELTPTLPQQDAIDEVVNYADLVEGLRKIARERPVKLLETLVQSMVPLAFADARVQQARITLRKPDIFDDAAAVGVTFDFTRG